MKEQELAALKAELRAKHPGHSFRIQKTKDDSLVIFRSPLPKEREDFVTKDDRGEVAAANRQITYQVTVYPDRAELDKILTKFGFLCETVCQGARDLGGMDAEEISSYEVEQIVEEQGLRDKHPEAMFYGLRKGVEVVIFRNATMPERQSAIGLRKKSAANAHKQLAQQTIVYPVMSGALLERYPFLCEKIAGAVLDMGGGEDLGEF